MIVHLQRSRISFVRVAWPGFYRCFSLYSYQPASIPSQLFLFADIFCISKNLVNSTCCLDKFYRRYCITVQNVIHQYLHMHAVIVFACALLQINGEAIYETVPWKFQNDTAAQDIWYTATKVSSQLQLCTVMYTNQCTISELIRVTIFVLENKATFYTIHATPRSDYTDNRILCVKAFFSVANRCHPCIIIIIHVLLFHVFAGNCGSHSLCYLLQTTYTR